jgi:hypothetical protein
VRMDAHISTISQVPVPDRDRELASAAVAMRRPAARGFPVLCRRLADLWVPKTRPLGVGLGFHATRSSPAQRRATEPFCQEHPEHLAVRRSFAPLLPSRPGIPKVRSGTSTRAPPAGITNRVGRFAGLRLQLTYCVTPGIYTFADDSYSLLS